MRLTPQQFQRWENKCVTLLGMSGVGKTRLASLLREQHWFHYSADYRIGTRYLNEPILDNIKQQAMQVPFLRELLRTDSIYISNNITVDNLKPVSTFLGMLGNPERGGLGLSEFKRRQRLYGEGEAASMKDVPEFIRKAREIYGYRHFVNDASGSLCEVEDPEVVRVLAEHTVILYIEATAREQKLLFERAAADPKPLYYREAFLDEHVALYLKEQGLSYVALIEPEEFARWVFPKLYRARLPRYEEITAEHGYKVSADEIAKLSCEADFNALVTQALERAPKA